MKKISKAALAGGVAAAATAATVGVAAPAQALETRMITTVVSWEGGDNWLEVNYGDGIVLEGSPIKSVTDMWYAPSGALIGADPIMGDADFITCTVMVNGVAVASDSASAGDGKDANCLRILR